jgi:hypothetical protein
MISGGTKVPDDQIFWLALDNAYLWRSMSELSRDNVEDIEKTAEFHVIYSGYSDIAFDL